MIDMPRLGRESMDVNPRPVSERQLGVLRLLVRGEATTVRLSEGTGLHPTVVRKYLRELAAAGLVRSTPIIASRGRPVLRYEITDAGRESFPTRYDLLLTTLSRGLRSRLGSGAAVDLFDDAAADIAKSVGAPKSTAEAVRVLEGMGFQPELRRENGHRVLLSHNCSILKVAKEHPELTCDAFHCTLLGELLGTSPRLLRQSISRGATYCVHDLGAPAPANGRRRGRTAA